MLINMKAFLKLLKDVFNNNQSEMARVLGIERSHLNKVFSSNGKGAGIVVFGAIIKYCQKNSLDMNDYIFFE